MSYNTDRNREHLTRLAKKAFPHPEGKTDLTYGWNFHYTYIGWWWNTLFLGRSYEIAKKFLETVIKEADEKNAKRLEKVFENAYTSDFEAESKPKRDLVKELKEFELKKLIQQMDNCLYEAAKASEEAREWVLEAKNYRMAMKATDLLGF